MEAMTTMSWTDDRLDGLGGKVDKLDERLGKVEVRLVKVEVKVDELDKRVGRLEHTVDEMRLEMQAGFRELRGEIKTMTTAMIAGFVTLFAAMLGVMATIVTQL
jgi:hypothetical protein